MENMENQIISLKQLKELVNGLSLGWPLRKKSWRCWRLWLTEKKNLLSSAMAMNFCRLAWIKRKIIFIWSTAPDVLF